MKKCRLAGLILNVTLFSCLTSRASADEPVISAEEAKRNGYVAIPYSPSGKTVDLPDQERLPWPFESLSPTGYLGNNYNQFQPYPNNPGYHWGVDVMVEEDSWILAPVSGRVEAGHYNYTLNPDGSKIKQWIPWPEQGLNIYFEVAVIADNGMRYELHHVDRYTLTQEVIDGLNSGNLVVEKGARLGKVYDWFGPEEYDHVHLNVVRPDGRHLNPEPFFTAIDDDMAPEVRFFAVLASGEAIWLEDNSVLPETPAAIYAWGHDRKNHNKWVHALTALKVVAADRSVQGFDFGNSIFTSNESVVSILDIYPSDVMGPDGTVIRQPDEFYPYDHLKFLMQVKLKSSVSGSVQVIAQDSAGNQTTVTIRVL